MDIRTQKVIIEYNPNEADWWTLFDDGRVETFSTPERAFKAVQRASKRGNKDATVTTIEWRNTGYAVSAITPDNRSGR